MKKKDKNKKKSDHMDESIVFSDIIFKSMTKKKLKTQRCCIFTV